MGRVLPWQILFVVNKEQLYALNMQQHVKNIIIDKSVRTTICLLPLVISIPVDKNKNEENMRVS